MEEQKIGQQRDVDENLWPDRREREEAEKAEDQD